MKRLLLLGAALFFLVAAKPVRVTLVRWPYT
jgi:hypothetical protein